MVQLLYITLAFDFKVFVQSGVISVCLMKFNIILEYYFSFKSV